jgi:hypothetical protein|tara:strand:+ start:348 stop:731 length:384 start_codon:yes stop_codon:yes gene_type:complete
MTNPTNTPRPIVKSTNPALYKRHTAHMKKAQVLTYNYSTLDDYVAENWESKTSKQMASDTNEYFTRVVYRVQVLKALGLIKNKNIPSKYGIIRQELIQEMKVLTVRITEIKKVLNDQLDQHEERKVG